LQKREYDTIIYIERKKDRMDMNNNPLANIPQHFGSKSTQPHKFFERFLDNDLDVLKAELQKRYELIEQAKIIGVTPAGPQEAWKQSNSVSTMKWQQYNVFQFHSDGIHNLYKAISDMEKGIDFFLGHILKNVELEYEERVKNEELRKIEEKPKGNPDAILNNPGNVNYEDLKAYLELKNKGRFKNNN
jgi:hypothetical protein